MEVYIVEGMEASYSDILGVYDSREKAQKKKEIEEDLGDYCSIVIYSMILNKI